MLSCLKICVIPQILLNLTSVAQMYVGSCVGPFCGGTEGQRELALGWSNSRQFLAEHRPEE